MLALLKTVVHCLTALWFLFAFAQCGFALEGSAEDKKKSAYYEYPGNYRGQIKKLKDNFKEKFGYELIDLEKGWTPQEIDIMRAAFSKLPDSFYRLTGLKGFYRRDLISGLPKNVDLGGIPAATWPRFRAVYRNSLKSHVVEVNDDPLRIEFYNPLFDENKEARTNIIQHEMGHAFDLANGFLSFQKEWLKLSRFRILNYPPLDAKPGDDFLFVLISGTDGEIYAPVSTRHISTYSRENPQEDFANSVSAYINYPYFRYSHARRYAFLKKKVFQEKEYFPLDKTAESYGDKVKKDLQTALEKNDWEEVVHIALETGRSRAPEIESEITEALRKATNQILSPGEYLKAVHATCYLFDPAALELRRDLAIRSKVSVPDVIKIERCFRMGTKVFDEKLSKWPMTTLFFYREGNKAALRFIDPALLTAHSRGFSTSYTWKIALADSPKRVLRRGKIPAKSPVTEAVKIDLEAGAESGFSLPQGKKLILELAAERTRSKPFKLFKAPFAKIQFVIYPWLKYQGPSPPSVNVIFPRTAAGTRQ